MNLHIQAIWHDMRPSAFFDEYSASECAITTYKRECLSIQKTAIFTDNIVCIYQQQHDKSYELAKIGWWQIETVGLG